MLKSFPGGNVLIIHRAAFGTSVCTFKKFIISVPNTKYCILHMRNKIKTSTYSFEKNNKFTVINLLKPTSHVMHQQFNIQQLYVLPTMYVCVLYLSENKQRLVPLTA